MIRTFAAPSHSANRRLVVAGDRLVAAGDRGQVVFGLADGDSQWTVGPQDAAEPGCAILAVSGALGRTYCASVFGEAVERDLATGEPTGRVLDPQLGAIAELVVTDQGHGLWAFSESQPYIARWLLDRPGAGGRLLAAGATSHGGYDPSGQFLLVSRGGQNEVVDASGAIVRSLSIDGRAVWLSSRTIGVLRDPPVLLDVDPEATALTTALGGHVEALYPETGGTHAWAMSRQDGTFLLRRFSLHTGKVDGPSVSGPVADEMRVVSDGTTLLVTERDGGPKGEWHTSIYDVASGALVTRGLWSKSPVTIAPGGRVVMANERGEVELRDAAYFDNLEPSFTGARGAVSSLQVSSDGKRLAVTSPDQMVSVFDLDTLTRLGDPVHTDAPHGVVEAWLRPDGQALVTNTASGVVEWDLHSEAMVREACDLAGRNPTPGERATYFPAMTQANPLCPKHDFDRIEAD